MMNKDYCIFILTHGRPDNVLTFERLLEYKFDGDIFIVIDNEDHTADQYYKKFGDKVLMFDKKKIAEDFDEGDNFNDRRSVFYARNACFSLASKVGYDYFIEMDDDYTQFRFKFDENHKFKSKRVKNISTIFDYYFEYYKSIPALSIALAQDGDFILGKYDTKAIKNWFNGNSGRNRKCMNSFFCSVHRPFRFVGRVNEDVNTYVNRGIRGELFLTIPLVALDQRRTQSNPGGMTELYLDSGTYIKTFYSVMYNPSCVKVSEMPSSNRRIHHYVNWTNAVPRIIKEVHKKPV